MNLPVVAAFLTLIGYSVNDTVVVFDRVRENLASKTVGDFRSVVNSSINQTLSRTVLTSTLTWVVCICLFVFGGPTLRDFSFVLSAGIIVGTYSSIYIAAPILVAWKDRMARRKGDAAPVSAHPSAKKIKAGGA
jgi:preprotein translocase subunit SecF